MASSIRSGTYDNPEIDLLRNRSEESARLVRELQEQIRNNEQHSREETSQRKVDDLKRQLEESKKAAEIKVAQETQAHVQQREPSG